MNRIEKIRLVNCAEKGDLLALLVCVNLDGMGECFLFSDK